MSKQDKFEKLRAELEALMAEAERNDPMLAVLGEAAREMAKDRKIGGRIFTNASAEPREDLSAVRFPMHEAYEREVRKGLDNLGVGFEEDDFKDDLYGLLSEKMLLDRGDAFLETLESLYPGFAAWKKVVERSGGEER